MSQKFPRNFRKRALWGHFRGISIKRALLGYFRYISESEHFWDISEKFPKASTFGSFPRNFRKRALFMGDHGRSILGHVVAKKSRGYYCPPHPSPGFLSTGRLPLVPPHTYHYHGTFEPYRYLSSVAPFRIPDRSPRAVPRSIDLWSPPTNTRTTYQDIHISAEASDFASSRPADAIC